MNAIGYSLLEDKSMNWTILKYHVTLLCFFLQAGFTAEGAESGTKFPEINLQEKVSAVETTCPSKFLFVAQMLTFQRISDSKLNFNP